MALVALVVVLLVLLIGSDDGHVVDPGWLDEEANGEVVYCSGEDVSGTQRRSVRDFNDSPDRGTATARLADDIPGKANRQREEYLERMKKGNCDVLYLDVIYTPEFAASGLLYDMTPYLKRDDLEESFEGKMMQTVAYGGKQWGVPKQLDGGVMYYRRDKVPPPSTWQRVARRAIPRDGEKPGLRLQLDAYEGLTVVFLELAYAAGAQQIISDDGKTANLNQPGTREALRFLQSLIRTRAVPESVTDQAERGSKYVFGVGRATFLRSWPYVEAALRRDAKHSALVRRTVKNLEVSPLPLWGSQGRRVGILGGHNLVIPSTAKNREGALHLIKFLTSEDQVLRDAKTASLAPVLRDLWDRDEVRASPALKAVDAEDLLLRPAIKSYWRVSRAIYTGVRRVLRSAQGAQTLPGELDLIEADVQRELDK